MYYYQTFEITQGGGTLNTSGYCVSSGGKIDPSSLWQAWWPIFFIVVFETEICREYSRKVWKKSDYLKQRHSTTVSSHHSLLRSISFPCSFRFATLFASLASTLSAHWVKNGKLESRSSNKLIISPFLVKRLHSDRLREAQLTITHRRWDVLQGKKGW